LANHIILSGVTVSMLFSPLMALPSGGKFTHGTSGTINTNGNNMNIVGNGTNSVIQWGGGFNIGKGESVNFGGTDKNYLNIAHGAGRSTIEGVLNAGGNNVFLINPNGVIIEKSGSIINAKNFMASTATLSDDDFNTFKNLSFENPQAFSPKIKPNSGNVVNLGKINATDSITLQGNKIVLEAGFDKGNISKIETEKLNLKGNEVYVDVGTTKVQKVNVEAGKGTLYLSATGYYYDPKRKYDEFNNVDNKIKKTYNQYISIGSDVDWWHFAKGWNEKDDFRDNVVGNTFKLTNDIDFGGNQGKNYANYCIDDGYCTNMIVGTNYSNKFRGVFDGQGYTLKNININTTGINVDYVGIFGIAESAEFKNINVDYNNGSIIADSSGNVGGFIGSARYVTSDQVKLQNIKEIKGQGRVGGFAGQALDSKFYNIYVQDIGYIHGLDAVGGFVGYLTNGIFDSIKIQDIGTISAESNKYESSAGGFFGRSVNGIGKFTNIKIDTIDSIKASGGASAHVGGFGGEISSQGGNSGGYTFENISLANIGNLEGSSTFANTPQVYIGGFIGWTHSISGISLKNIYINFKDDAKFVSTLNGPYGEEHIGKVFGRIHNSVTTLNFENVHVYHKNGILSNAISDKNYITEGKINIHEYDNRDDQSYNDFVNNTNKITDPKLPDKKEKDYLSAQEAKKDQATLTQDDLYESIVKDIFNSLNGHSYAIDLNTLQAFLEAYDKLSDTKSKEDFLANFLLDKSEYTEEERENLARSLVQSLDFILAYSKNDAKDSKFESGVVEDTFVKLKAEAGAKHSNALEQGEKLRAYVESLINPVNSIKNNNGNIADNNTEIKELQDEYNSLANSINKGLLDEDELSIAQKRLREIVARIEVLLENNEKLQNENKDLLAKISVNTKDFRTYGVSSSISETPTLSAVILNPSANNGNDNNGDISNGSDASQVVSSLQKQDSDKLGNAAVVDEEEKNEVEEASLVQKGKICIVSDNSKTMNPCIVGGL
ncbi:filamentous hemagglutinin N-terminal domain-containing protein, partial [Campylobacter lari]|nr:filamentous hemagglutinin N-terminal domain-containing protein [Campylobacter lari]